MALTYRGTKGSPLTIEEIDSNFAYFTGSHSITGSLTISGSIIVSGSILSTEALQISGTLTPIDSEGSSLGSPEFYWGELYIGLDSVNFMGQPNSLVASIKTWGEGATYFEPASGMVYIAPWYTSGSSVVQRPLRGSFGVGTGSIALGTGSVTLGRNLLAFGNHQTVVGAFNQTSSANSAFIIGNGISTGSRSNLLFASGSQIQVTGSIITNGVYMTPQTINNDINVPSNTNALLIGPQVSLNNTSSIGTNSVLTVLGNIDYSNDVDANSVTTNNITLNLNTLVQATNDTEAAAAGVNIGGLYRSGNYILVRLT
jgi:hypothetical protein